MERFVDGCFSQLHGFSPDFNSRKCPSLSLDVIESNESITVKAEIPGLSEEDFVVTIHGDSLTIKGEKKLQTALKEEVAFSRECQYGPFERTVKLGRHVDESRMKASYQKGVVAITLPKLACNNKIDVFTAEQ
jgi:HSP20 family protein